MLVDMSEVIDDPELQDTFTVNRRLQNTSTLGIVSTTPTSSTVSGAVYPAGDNMLKRAVEAQYMGKTIEIVARFRFQGPAQVLGTQYQPDTVTWGGDTYVVFFVEDYSHYGTGFVHAGASSIDNIDQPPSA